MRLVGETADKLEEVSEVDDDEVSEVGVDDE